MKLKRMLNNLLPALVFLALAPTALASSLWYADGVHGSNSNGCKSAQTACKTIMHAISLAAAGDSIIVAAATYIEWVQIGFNLRVIGAGAETTIIVLPNGSRAFSAVQILTGANVTLSKLTITNGHGIYGGGIYNVGNLTINDSAVSNNLAFCHNQVCAGGGGIYNGGDLTINDSAVSNNDTLLCNPKVCPGGGIYNIGNLTINNSTLSGNSAGDGGAIYNRGILKINNSTVSGNSAGVGGGIVSVTGGQTYIQNSIVAKNSGGNCAGAMTSSGYNLSGDHSCSFRNAGDLNNTDPKLAPLAYNGGSTETMALLLGSPAIDSGNPGGCTDGNGILLKTDQRGAPRHDKEDTRGCDRGAFERQND